MNTRARHLILPLGGALIATGLIGATLTTSAGAETKPTPVKSGKLANNGTDAKAIAGAWTPSKLKAATHYNEDSSLSAKLKASTSKASADGKAGSIAPTGDGDKTAGTSKNVNLPTNVGKVFFQVDGKPYWCSGTSVQSKYHNLVATAGHCVYDTDANKYVDNFVFIPGYYQGKAPWGIYVGGKVNLHSDFTVYEDYDYDYAFVNVYNGIKQTGEKTVDKATFDAYKGPKWAKDVEITKDEYQKKVDEKGGETADAWSKSTGSETVLPWGTAGGQKVLKEVTKDEYDKAPAANSKQNFAKAPAKTATEFVDEVTYNNYKGPGYKKMVDSAYTITHYFVKYWVKKATSVKYYKTVFTIKTFVDAGRLGDNVGGQGFTWNRSTKAKQFSFGYPTASHLDGNKAYTGETMKWCYGQTAAAPAVSKYKAEEQLAIKCAFTPGATGGPFLIVYKNANRTGYLNGVVSLTLDTDGNGRYDHITTPYFNSDTYGVYKAAASQWTGKLTTS
ncbi:hypothetical protein ABZT47_37695 [Sphaerisporangium sp. NPDC005289]|uniref:trypsin-like serine peptidase n=1 Tax=Sphaerisporangium sp. NPDC005289 TaxID=3155247 RepID=UPI0033B8F2BB